MVRRMNTLVRDFSAQLPHLRMGGLSSGDVHNPTVILLHGFPELSESWRDVLPILAAAGLHAVAPDLRGYGKTDKPSGGYDLDTLAGDVAALIEHVSPDEPVHLVGHDWGGAVAYHVAAFHPSKVRTLAVVNCPHPGVMARRMWRPAQLRRSWYMFFFQLPFLPERVLASDEGRRVPKLMRRTMVDSSRLTPERSEPYARNFSDLHAAKCALAYYRQMFRGVLSPRGAKTLFSGYPRIEAPFRLVWGSEDVALGKALTVGLDPYFALPPEVDYLDGVGHFAPIEAPERVAESLLAHLVTHRGESGRSPGVTLH